MTKGMLAKKELAGLSQIRSYLVYLGGGQKSMIAEDNDPRMAGSLEEQLDHAAEELITGDSDDPPLSEEAVLELIRATHMPKPSGSVT